MSPKKQPRKSASCSASLTVPDLEQSKTTVLNMLVSALPVGAINTPSKNSSPGIALSVLLLLHSIQLRKRKRGTLRIVE
jgi:hypothetical protein